MASKRARKRARQQANRARGGARTTKRQSRGGRSGGRGDRVSRLVTKSTARFFAKKAIESGVGTVGGGIGGFARSQIVRRTLTVARQRASKLPGIGRLFRTTQRSRGQVPLVNFGTRAVTRRSTAALATRAAVPVAVGAGAAGVAFEAGRTIFDAIPGGVDMVRRIRAGGGGSRRTRGQAVPFKPGALVPTDSITHTWVANGVPFAQLADGRVMVRRNNGTIKTFRRPRPIVLGRNPGVRDLMRADKKIDGLLKMVRKRFPAARRRHSVAHN